MPTRALRSHAPMIEITEQALCGLSQETLVDLVLFYQAQITDLKREQRALQQVIASQHLRSRQQPQTADRTPRAMTSSNGR